MRDDVGRIARGRGEKGESISTCHKHCGPPACTPYLPCVTSRFIPGVFILHGGIYLTDRELFVWAA